MPDIAERNLEATIEQVLIHGWAGGGQPESTMKIRSCQPRFQGNFHRLPSGSVAFDAMGRRVQNPKTGVYFVRLESDDATLARKAIKID